MPGPDAKCPACNGDPPSPRCAYCNLSPLVFNKVVHTRDEALRRLPMVERAWFWIGQQNPKGSKTLFATPEEFTCHGCWAEPTCESAWDFYNTDGDCLEAK